MSPTPRRRLVTWSTSGLHFFLSCGAALTVGSTLANEARARCLLVVLRKSLRCFKSIAPDMRAFIDVDSSTRMMTDPYYRPALLLGCNLKRGVGGRHARIDRDLQQHFFQIAQFEAAGQTGAQVQAKFFPTPE